MDLTMSAAQRAELEATVAAAQRTRAWKRYQAVLLVAAGESPVRVAQALRCHVASVYDWVARWRQGGVTGLAEGPHPGATRRLDAAGEALLERLLSEDPQAHGHQATGWTVALLHGELTRAGYSLGPRTVRRALHRRGYRWKRPHYVLGRPDPDYEAKKGG